jgi:hypothetical protein
VNGAARGVQDVARREMPPYTGACSMLERRDKRWENGKLAHVDKLPL